MTAGILAYLQAMFGLNGVGLMNTQAMFLGNEYLVLLIIALVACLPVGSLLVHRLKSSKTGPAMALYRVGEKVTRGSTKGSGGEKRAARRNLLPSTFAMHCFAAFYVVIILSCGRFVNQKISTS